MEGSFADAATHHGFKQARWRRLWRQWIQDLLIATVQNLRILVRHASRRVRGACLQALGQAVPAFNALFTVFGLYISFDDIREVSAVGMFIL